MYIGLNATTHNAPIAQPWTKEWREKYESIVGPNAACIASCTSCALQNWKMKKKIPKWMDRPNERTKKLFTPLEWDDVYDEEEEEEDGKRCFLFDFAIAAAAAAIALCSFTHTKISDFVCSDTVHHTLYACSTRSIHFSEFFFSAASSAFSVLRTE